MAGTALHGLSIIFRAGFKYRKAGIMLMDLQPETRRQSVLFDAGRWCTVGTRHGRER